MMVASILDHALRRAGRPVTDATGDILTAGLNNLSFILTTLSNDGVNLWAMEKVVIGLVQNVNLYTLPDTMDVTNVLYRVIANASGGTATSSTGTASNAFDSDINTYCTQTAPNGYIQYAFSSPSNVNTIGILPYGDQTLTLVWEYSSDGVNWTQAAAWEKADYTDKKWVCADIPIVNTSYFRVRETGNGTINVRAVTMAFSNNETPLGRVNIDMYTGLNNKSSPARQPLQFWFDRQINAPVLTLWPVPSYSFDQLAVYKTRTLNGPLTLRDTLDIPQRWYDAIVYELSMKMLLEIPGADLSRIDTLSKLADVARSFAVAEERDASPVTLQVDIGVYTR